MAEAILTYSNEDIRVEEDAKNGGSVLLWVAVAALVYVLICAVGMITPVLALGLVAKL